MQATEMKGDFEMNDRQLDVEANAQNAGPND